MPVCMPDLMLIPAHFNESGTKFGAQSIRLFLRVRVYRMSVLDRNRISTGAVFETLNEFQFVSFDVETTGLSPVVARLVELSGVKFKLNGEVISTFSSLINPQFKIPPEVSAIHGITDEMVADSPACAEVLPKFFEWIDDDNAILVAHNAPFDVEFLQVGLSRMGQPLPAYRIIDTLPLARALIEDSPNYQLKTLVEFLALETGGYHRALADSHHVRNVLQTLLVRHGLSAWPDLLELGCTFIFDSNLHSFEPPAHLSPCVDSLKEAIASSSTVSFIYNGLRSYKRTVDPIAVIQSRGNYYLTAFCHRAQEERTFRLDKISEINTVKGASRDMSPVAT